ncbi:peroxiredoxin [Primorskyibacter sp. S87]|uniref:peroxiredoxin n=1 Tax=Primorskyibacter sp. S87 TaxID=3415126 RepID=UPI003C7C3129
MDTRALSTRLTGQPLPSVALSATNGTEVDLSRLDGCTVVYTYPRTSPPDGPAIDGWDEIPGAKGCTPQSCGFRDHYAELQEAGANNVFGLSVQGTDYQREARDRLELPFEVLSDAEHQLRAALDLPVFEAGGMVLLERFAMVAVDGVVSKVFHPVSNPAENAKDVLGYLQSQG